MARCTNDQAGCKPRCFKIVLLVVIGIAVLGGVVMLLWNWLMPAVFAGAKPVDYFQALGILALSKILFGGFRGGGSGRWRERHQRWESLSPQERAQLKERFKGRWGPCCGSTGGDDEAPKEPPARAE